jgi:malonate-semialdehyde dehydrogenase (acetylating) / methylmalonate-semialdehyde dehydrogenase
VTEQHRDNVAFYIDLAEADGAKIVMDGRNSM